MGGQLFTGVRGRNVLGMGDTRRFIHKDAAEHFLKLHAMMRDGVGVPENGSEYIVGPWLTFDPKTERHTGEFAQEANALLQDRHNPGFEIPTVGKV